MLVSALTMQRVLTCFLTLIFLLAPSLAQNESPQSIKIKGLKERVMIARDERGIPYIDAKSDDDLYFAQGYATAADRLVQMDLFRRTARGELAEILGAGPNNFVLDQDKLHRTYGFAQEADAEIAQASPKSLAIFEAYARGVNAYAASLDPKSMPPEFQILSYSFRPWTPADSLIIIKIFAESLSDTWRLDLMRQAMASLPAEKRNALLVETSPLDVLVVGKDAKAASAKSIFPKPSTENRLSVQALTALAHNQAVAAAALDRIGFYAE